MKVLLITNTGLGDGLIFNILAQNLKNKGCSVKILTNKLLLTLKSYFPGFEMQAYPETEEQWKAVYQGIDQLFVQEYAPAQHLKYSPVSAVYLGESRFGRSQSFGCYLRDYSNTELGIENPTLDNGLVVPDKSLVQGKFPKRLVIQPSSANPQKNWPQKKFIKAAHILENKGFSAVFCLPPEELEAWQDPLKEAGLAEPLVLPLPTLASYLYESGLFLGNDASIGHLAANLGVKSYLAFDRKRRANFWAPCWSGAQAVLPYPVPTRFLRTNYWKNLLTVNKLVSEIV